MRLRPNRLLLLGLCAAGAAKLGASAPGGWAPDLAGRLDALWGRPALAATAAPPAPETPARCEPPEAVFAAIDAERQSLAAQREAAETRATELELGRIRLAAEAERLASIRDELAATLGRIEARQSADMARLVDLYRGMKPKQAASIMDDADMEVLIAVLGAMEARDAAPILAQLDPVRARAISRLILERSKLPADRDLSDLRLR